VFQINQTIHCADTTQSEPWLRTREIFNDERE